MSERYRPRRTWLVEARELASWSMKIYAITYSGEDLPPTVLSAATTFAAERLENDPLLMGSPPSKRDGFLVIHLGSEAVWLLLDLWHDDILHHHTYRAELDAPTEFGSVMTHGGAACVWELEVIQHERDAWVEHVLGRSDQPDVAGYRGASLTLPG